MDLSRFGTGCKYMTSFCSLHIQAPPASMRGLLFHSYLYFLGLGHSSFETAVLLVLLLLCLVSHGRYQVSFTKMGLTGFSICLPPPRVISRAQGLKLVVETLMSSLKPIGNIVVICCAFFIIFGILGVQVGFLQGSGLLMKSQKQWQTPPKQ